MAETMALKSVEISFNQRTSQIELVSRDRRLQDGPARIALDIEGSNRSAHRQLLNLLVAGGKAQREDPSYPSYPLKLSGDKLAESLRRNRPERTVVGLGRESKEVALDLTKNLLIAGGTGSGKSVALRTVICSALESEDIALWAIDLKRVELEGYAYGPMDRLATTMEDALSLLDELKREMNRRLSSFSDHSSWDRKYTNNSPIYLVIDELGLVLGGNSGSSRESRLENARMLIMGELLEVLAAMGRHVGIYLILGAQQSDGIPSESKILGNIGNRILMGRSHIGEERLILGAPSEFGALQLSPRGRGVHSVHGVQQLFHSYFVPYDAYSKA